MANPLVPLVEIIFQIFLVFFFLRIFIAPGIAGRNQVFAAISQVTEPVLAKTRNWFYYRTSRYDLSPLLPILILLLAQGAFMGLLNPVSIGQATFNVLSGFMDWLFQVYAVIVIVTSLTSGFGANPIVTFLMKVSEPLVSLTRKFIVFNSNGWRFLALIPLVLIFVCFQSLLAFVVSLGSEFGLGVLSYFFINALAMLVGLTTFFTIVIIVGALMSWFSPDPYNPLTQFINILTFPLLSPIQRVLPSLGGIDLSPVVAILLLQFINGAGKTLLNALVS